MNSLVKESLLFGLNVVCGYIKNIFIIYCISYTIYHKLKEII